MTGLLVKTFPCKLLIVYKKKKKTRSNFTNSYNFMKCNTKPINKKGCEGRI